MSHHRWRKPTPTYEEIVTEFVKGCGLRQSELERLRIRDFYRKKRDFVYELQWIHIEAHEDIPTHEVPVFEDAEWTIARLCRGHTPDDLVSPTLPPLEALALQCEYWDKTT